MDDVLRAILVGIVMPLWIVAGVADWVCHRQTHIQTTGGVVESDFHLLLYAIFGIGGLAVLTLEITSAVLLLLLALWLLHELVTWLELRYVFHRREIRPSEQIVHSLLEMLPFSALLILAALHPDQARGLVQWASADWSLASRAEPIPFGLAAGLVGATLALNAIPLLEENLRCRRMIAPLRRARFALR